jgi:hypothetical protein
MTRRAAILMLAMAMSGTTPRAVRAVGARTPAAAPPDTVQVAPPTGDRTRDHASIVAAFGRADAGDTIQFARGTYVVGEIIQDSTPGITLLGAAAGTVLQGCTPEGYGKLGREEKELHQKATFRHGGPRPHLTPQDRARMKELVRHCGMFQLTGGHDTVRGLTFEYTRLGLDLGSEPQQGHQASSGGYLIEGNTFRNSQNGIRAGLSWSDSSVIRRNTFVDTYHAVIGWSQLHVLENTVLAPAPSRVPNEQFPSLALGISDRPPGAEAGRCGGTVIAENLIEGYPSGISLFAGPGRACRTNVIRDNTVAVRRVPLLSTSIAAGWYPLPDETDSSFVGVPITVAAPPVTHERSGRVESTRIEGNRILGAEGYGIAIEHASHVRVADNTIAGILVRDPYPGNTHASPAESPDANGSGIWVSAGSDDNEISGNTFADIATYAILLEGDRNTVRIRRPSDRVRDLGTGNHVLTAAPDGAAVRSDGAPRSAARSPAAPSAGAPTRAECQVWNRQKAYYRYLAAGDTAGFRTLWSRRFVGWPGGAPAPASMADTANFSRYLSSIVRAHEDSTRRWHVELRPMSVADYGDNIVVTLYAEGSYAVDTRSGVKAPERWTKLIHTWKRYGSRWRIITGMAAPLDTAPVEPSQMHALTLCRP